MGLGASRASRFCSWGSCHPSLQPGSQLVSRWAGLRRTSLRSRGDVHRFRVEAIGDEDTLLLADGGLVHHLKNVLRLHRGDEITVFDDAGRECLCLVDGVGREGVTLAVQARTTAKPRKARLTIACAVPKRGMDEVID